ncbi:hypothetical protein ACIQ1H_09165 [Lysinibacillus sp. NPDC097279]|uniref:hypothetical protein n=1 Tax=Lysinibacillus sp. NPDC097279 TaxID=3364143 RepID=UPI00381ECB24
MIGYVYCNPDNSYTLFYTLEGIPEVIKKDLIEAEIPEGDGILRREEDGSFYWELPPEPTPEPEPEPVPPVETIEEKINNLFSMTEQNNLITVDAVLGVYEEVLALREEVAALKEITNNA